MNSCWVEVLKNREHLGKVVLKEARAFFRVRLAGRIPQGQEGKKHMHACRTCKCKCKKSIRLAVAAARGGARHGARPPDALILVAPPPRASSSCARRCRCPPPGYWYTGIGWLSLSLFFCVCESSLLGLLITNNSHHNYN